MKTHGRGRPSKNVSERDAKSHFSEIVREVSEGAEIIITWHGDPRVRMCAIEKGSPTRFEVDWQWLRDANVSPQGIPSEEIIRQDRDGRN